MPLTGRRVVNTRATHQLSRLTALLEAHGAEVVEYPCLAIVPPADPEALTRALDSPYDWLVLTSANTVTALAQLGYRFDNLRLAAVGPATAAAARTQLGVEAQVLPERFTAQDLGEALPLQPGARVLLPASALARPALAETLTARGADVTVVAAYRTVLGSGGAPVPQLLAQEEIDAITFTSASTVENFLRRLDAEGGTRAHLENVCLAAIGPQTAAALEQSGLVPTVLPETHTLEGLVGALSGYYSLTQ